MHAGHGLYPPAGAEIKSLLLLFFRKEELSLLWIKTFKDQVYNPQLFGCT
jgi:hypothetical protein